MHEHLYFPYPFNLYCEIKASIIQCIHPCDVLVLCVICGGEGNYLNNNIYGSLIWISDSWYTNHANDAVIAIVEIWEIWYIINSTLLMSSRI